MIWRALAANNLVEGRPMLTLLQDKIDTPAGACVVGHLR